MEELIKNILRKIGILLIIAFIIIIIREFILWHGVKSHLDKSNPMTREEITALLDKGAKYPNYSFSIAPESIFGIWTYGYVKDNIASVYDGNKLRSITNYITGEIIYPGGNHITLDVIENKQHGSDYSIVADYETYKCEYEYLGEKEFQGRRAIFIQMNAQGDNIRSLSTIFIIDKETGLILLRTDFQKILFITEYKRDCNRNVNFEVCEKI